MQYLLFFLLFFSTQIIKARELISDHIIFIMGPSCSGKSTITKALLEKLGIDDKWSLIEYDTLEDVADRKVDREEIFKQIIAIANEALDSKKNVIIDTNTFYAQHCALLKTNRISFIFIYAPLPVLFERNDMRNKILNRSEKQARIARNFVETSFYEFYPKETFLPNEYIIDTTKQSLPDTIKYLVSTPGVIFKTRI